MGAYVVLPRDLLERNGVDILVENQREGNDEVEDVEALRAQRVRQDLDRVGDDQRRERDAEITVSASVIVKGCLYNVPHGHSLIEGIEQEDERDDRVRGSRVAGDRKPRGADGLHGEKHHDTSSRGKEELAAAGPIDQERRKNGPRKVPNRKDAIRNEDVRSHPCGTNQRHSKRTQ